MSNPFASWDTCYEAKLAGFDDPTYYCTIHEYGHFYEEKKASDYPINWNGIPIKDGMEYYSKPPLLQLIFWLKQVHNILLPMTLEEAPEHWKQYISTEEEVLD